MEKTSHFVVHHAPIDKRKGAIVGPGGDRELSEYGIEVAHRQADNIYRMMGTVALNGMGDMIISSPLRRAVQTSEIIAERCDLDIVFDPRLRAQDFGCLDGLTFSEIAESVTLRHHLWDFIPELSRDGYKSHGGESNKEMVDRVADFTEKIFQDDTGSPKSSLIVTHGTVIDSMIARIDRKRLDQIEGMNRIFEGRILRLSKDRYDAIGDQLAAFSFIPRLAHEKTIESKLEIIRDYVERCPRIDEQNHLSKLLSILERENII